MIDYDVAPSEYMKLKVEALTNEDLNELSYFTWAMYPDNNEVQEWRRLRVLPEILKRRDGCSEDDDFT